MIEVLKSAFNNNFLLYGEIGASVSVWRNGTEIISFNKGHASVDHQKEWSGKTLVPVFSATKGLASATFLLALHRAGLSPSIQAGEIWPMFPLPEASVAQVLSHQCGLAALVEPADLFDHDASVTAIEKSTPAWEPPQHGYHPHTFGPIIQELMLRISGETIGEFWEREIRKPLDMDFYLGLPESEFHRVATLYPAKADKEELNSPFYKEYLQPGTAIYRAFHSLPGLGTVRSMNTPKAWTSAAPALGGVASAHGMAKFYQCCLGHMNSPFPKEIRQWMGTSIIDGDDLTLMVPTSFSCGFMMDPKDPTGNYIRNLFGNGGFGHAGAGGSHAFAMPDSGISFAYTMNHMDLNVLPGKKTASLIPPLMKICRSCKP